MSVQLPDARQLSDETLQVLRLRALRGIELGYSELELADLLGVCNETISRWWTAYAAEGLPALPGGRTGRPLGSGRFLSDQQAERIKGCIDNHCPQEVGIPHALWTRRAVRDLIRKEFGIDLAERTVGQVAVISLTSAVSRNRGSFLGIFWQTGAAARVLIW
jgi:transposase